jgi:hypothetical protein
MARSGPRPRPAGSSAEPGATPTRRAISRLESPPAFNLITSRTWRIASLSVGIQAPFAKPKGGTVSEPEEASSPRATSSRNGGRDHSGMVGDIERISEASNRSRVTDVTPCSARDRFEAGLNEAAYCGLGPAPMGAEGRQWAQRKAQDTPEDFRERSIDDGSTNDWRDRSR